MEPPINVSKLLNQLQNERDSDRRADIIRKLGDSPELESAKFSVRHFDKMPKSLALKGFQRL